MKSLFIVMSLVTALAGTAAFAQDRAVPVPITSEQTLTLIKELKVEVAAKRAELAQVEARVVNDKLFFDIGDRTSSFSGWAAFFGYLWKFGIGTIPTIKTGAGQFVWGAVLVFGITETLERHYANKKVLSAGEKKRLDDELAVLQERLQGLEDRIVRQIQSAPATGK
jgi:hypothetical protein